MEAIPFRASHTLMGKAISFRESPEAVARRSSIKKEFLEILQNSQENTCASLFFNKVAGLGPQACNFINKETLAQVFPVNFAKFLRTPFFTEHLRWLLLKVMEEFCFTGILILLRSSYTAEIH